MKSEPRVPVTARVTKTALESLNRLTVDTGLSLSEVICSAVEAGLASDHLGKLLRRRAARRKPETLSDPRSFTVTAGERRRLEKIAGANGWELAEACRRLLRAGSEHQRRLRLVPPREGPDTRLVPATLPTGWVERIDGIADRVGATRSSVLRVLVQTGLSHLDTEGMPEPGGGTTRVSATLPSETEDEMRRVAGGVSVAAAVRRLVGVGLTMVDLTERRLAEETLNARSVRTAVRFHGSDLEHVRRLAAESGISETAAIRWLLCLGERAVGRDCQ